MANAGQFAQDEQILQYCGTGASATVKGAGWFDVIILHVEATINSMTRYDWSVADAASSLTSTARELLCVAGGSMAANIGIAWDMSGYTTRTEAENLININRDRYLMAIAALRDKKVETFIRGA